MHNQFILNYPGRIIFGKNLCIELPQYLPKNSRILLVTGNSAVKSGLQEKLIDSLSDFYVLSIAGIPPESPLESVDNLIEIGRSEEISSVVAAGGGSVIDAAKAAAAIIPKKGVVTDYFYGRRSIESKGLFFAAAPTTAGTGAEITNNAVLSDPATKIKKSIRHPSMTADVAIIDPVLTISSPPELTAATGLDAFTQALESFVASEANIVSQTLAKSAVKIIFENILNAYKDGTDINARMAMAQGSLLSGMAFSQSGLGAVHGLAHPIGTILGLSHGLTCSILLVPVLKWNLPVCTKEYDELASACGYNNAKSLFKAIEALCVNMNIPRTFSGFGLEKSHFPFIVKNCRSNSMKCNPRAMNDKNITDMLRRLI